MHQVQTNVTWPSDTHAGAELANVFMVTDDGLGVFVTFGHVAPDPVPKAEVAERTPRIKSSVFISHADAKKLSDILNDVAALRIQQTESQGK